MEQPATGKSKRFFFFFLGFSFFFFFFGIHCLLDCVCLCETKEVLGDPFSFASKDKNLLLAIFLVCKTTQTASKSHDQRKKNLEVVTPPPLAIDVEGIIGFGHFYLD